MKIHMLTAITLVAALAGIGSAQAAFVVNTAVGGGPATGSTYVNFDTFALGGAGGSGEGISLSFNGNGGVVNGTSSLGEYAPPYISNSNGAAFGDSTVSGADTTNYIATGIGSATVVLPGDEHYLGLLWGSVDSYNSLAFYMGSTLIGTLTGSDITAAANGNQGAMGTFYANITSGQAFDKVVASSSSYAFEFDNLAFNAGSSSQPVPEPLSLSLVGLGMVGAGVLRRRRT